MQQTWNGQPTARMKVYAYLDNGGSVKDTTETIMAACDCSRGLANRYLKDYVRRGQQWEQCGECGLLASHAPIQNGICLYCWARINNFDIRRTLEETEYTMDEIVTMWGQLA